MVDNFRGSLPGLKGSRKTKCVAEHTMGGNSSRFGPVCLDMNKSCSETQISKALDLYANSDLSSQEIADKFHVSSATLTSWAKGARVKLRGRGRRRYEEPTPRQRAIIETAQVQGYQRTAEKFGIGSKQAIYNLVKRWNGWKGGASPNAPQPGDLIQFLDKKLKVVSNDGEGGGIGTEPRTGKRYRILNWVVKGRLPKKLKAENGHSRNGRTPKTSKKK